MKKKVLAVVMGVLFVADVVMTLFNFDIFSSFLKEKRKENDERIKKKRFYDSCTYSSFGPTNYRVRGRASYNDTNDDAKWERWSKNLRENFLKKDRK